jgi:hypothetical protein
MNFVIEIIRLSKDCVSGQYAGVSINVQRLTWDHPLKDIGLAVPEVHQEIKPNLRFLETDQIYGNSRHDKNMKKLFGEESDSYCAINWIL